MTRDQDQTDLSEKVILAQRGDEGALLLLVKLSQVQLMRFCVYLCGNEEHAKDLCQETFVRVLESLQTLKNPSAFHSWLFKTAKNQFLDRVKSPKNAANISLEDLQDLPDPIEIADRDLRIQLQSALSHLDPNDRALLLLVDLEGYKYSETAEIMDISESDVRNRLHRIRRVVAKKIG